MGLEAALTSTSDAGWERRARRLPWGIEIQVWRLVETQTFPVSAGNLTLSTLLTDSEPTGTIPVGRGRSEDEDVTLENLELEYVGEEE
jgi:hypothetical protein